MLQIKTHESSTGHEPVCKVHSDDCDVYDCDVHHDVFQYL